MADTKNYGLKGVGDDVQFGKAGGRFVFNTGASDFRVTTDGTTLAHLQVLTPVGDTDAATKLYVDDVASGLDVKESVTAATTGDISGTYNSTAGPTANGQHTGVPATIDGVTLAQGDRILLKDQSPADENGIYEVQATTTTLNRASDFDSDAEVTAGAFTFVEEGTTNADSGWVLQGPDPLTVGTGSGSNLNFVLFSTSSDIVAGTGLLKTGNVLDLDFSQLASASVIATSDELIFQDSAVESRITVANFLADRDIVTITANGIVTRTTGDTYVARTITASSTATEEGLIVTNGDGVPGNPTIGLDIQGTTSAGINAVNVDELILFDGTNNRAYSITELAAAPAFGGGGTVTSSGSPLNNEVAVFATATDINSDSTFTWDATTLVVNELSFAGDTISNNTTDQPLILRPNGTGSIIFQNGSSEEMLELLDIASAINGLSITPGITGTAGPQIGIGTGGEANVDIGFVTAGTGVLSVAGGAGTYEDNVTADDDIPNKRYVDDQIALTGGSGTLDSVTGSVDLTTASTQNIGAATGIPANATILSVILDVTTLSDAVTTVTVGDVTNGAASYMTATENDPETADIYIADGRLLNGGAARQATATVAVQGTVGAATCIITFRHV